MTSSSVTRALACLLLGASGANAQTIQGTVRSSGVPIVGATVRLLELDRVTRSGAEGKFTFAHVPSGSYRVYAGTTGYIAVTDTVRVADSQVTVTFDLKQSAIPLKEIVVTASPVPRPANDQYQAVESKSGVQFDNSAGMNYAEKISDLPGVAARWNGSASARPILRGLGDNEVLVLENGLRMGDIATYDPAHATPIDALSIAQIDVVRGPSTILYGPNTIGGLVNVITNFVPTPSDHPFSGTAAVEGNGVSNQLAGHFNSVYTFGGSAIGVSAGGLHSGNIGIPTGNYTDPVTGASFHLSQIPQSDDHSEEGGAGYSYQGAFGMAGIGFDHYEMNYGIPGVPPNADWLTVPPTTSRISQERNTIEFRSLFNTSGWFKRVKFVGSYNDYSHSEFPTLQDSSGVSDPQANHFHKRELNAVLQFQQQPWGRLTGTLGLWTDIQDLTIEGQQPLGPNSLTTGFAGYAYEEYQAAPNTRLQAGARFDYNKIQTRPDAASQDTTFQTISASRLSNALTASLGIVQQFTSALTGSLSAARSFRAPTVQELFANGLDASSGSYSIGDSTLAPESGYGFDAVFQGSFTNAEFEFSPYLNYINNYIYGFLTGDTIQGFPVRRFTSSNARLWGFEVAATVAPVRFIALQASADYVNAQNTQLNVPLPFIPPLRGLLRATYQDQTYTGFVEWRAADSQTRLGVGDTPTAGWVILNFGVGFRIPERSVVHNIGIRLNNAFNRVYRDNLSVIKDFVPQPGRGLQVNYELYY